MDVQVTGIEAVVADLEAFPGRLAVNLRKAVQVTSQKVRDDARRRVSGYRHLTRYPYSITYDTKVTPDGVEGEIGPDKTAGGSKPNATGRSRRQDKGTLQGSLGNIIEFGTSKNAPIPHLGPALDANAADLLAGVDIAVRQATQ